MWAQTALDAFAKTTNMDAAGEDDSTVLADLLTDLMHWCDDNGVDFKSTLAASINRYDEEVANEPAEEKDDRP